VSTHCPTEPQTPPLVELDQVTKQFGSVTAVDQASFTLSRGSVLTILGPSGCGKTTLLQMIAGFETPSSGEIRLNGLPVSTVPPHRRSIGMVFQNLALFPHMTAAQNIAYPLKMRRFDPALIPALVAKYLDLVRLPDMGDRRIHQLSGGQRQRVAIARALSFGPDLLLLDEPLSALDKKLREEMQLEFRRIQQELGVTTINVTHDQREALVMSDEIIVMAEGCIQQNSDPVQLYRQPANPFVASFIGLTTLLRGTVSDCTDDMTTLSVGRATLLGRSTQPLAAGSSAEGAIRAEQVRISGLDRPLDAMDTILAGVVDQAIFEGDRMVYQIRCPDLADTPLFVFDHDPAHHRLHKRGDAVSVGWNIRDLLIYPGAGRSDPA
jgi:putative spermidine/putrescine transport system ATP-binding protein